LQAFLIPSNIRLLLSARHEGTLDPRDKSHIENTTHAMLTGRSASAFLAYGLQSQILFTSRLGWSLVLELRTQQLVSLLPLRSWQTVRYSRRKI